MNADARFSKPRNTRSPAFLMFSKHEKMSLIATTEFQLTNGPFLPKHSTKRDGKLMAMTWIRECSLIGIKGGYLGLLKIQRWISGVA